MTQLSLEATLTLARASEGRIDAASRIDPARRENLRAQADDFETMFLEQMLNRVFAAGGEEGMLAEAGPGAEAYRSMMVSEYAKLVTKSGGIGLSDQIYRELLKMQEG